MSDLATRLATTGQLLVRSGIEIDRILSSMVDEHSTVSASVPGQAMFLSRLLRVDPVKQHVMLAYSDYQDANDALLQLPSVNFRCHHRWGQFAFACRKPRLRELAGRPAIKMNGPDMVLALQHNKKAVRAQVPKDVPDLRCQLPIGTVVLETRLVDMSLDGHAFLLGDAELPICAGTWIRGARITPQAEEPVRADIELKYIVPIMLPDGERATRIGCRIVGADGVMEKLVGRFIIDFQ
jgi:c-di-GMP-binding flagellar brake protein YcgR